MDHRNRFVFRDQAQAENACIVLLVLIIIGMISAAIYLSRPPV